MKMLITSPGKSLLLTALVTPFILFQLLLDPTPPRRAHHSVVYDELNKCIVLSGGSTPLNGGSSFEFFNDLWCFKETSWYSLGTSGTRRSGMQMAYDSKRKKVYSFGGFSGDSSHSDLRVLENGSWVTVSYLPSMKAAEPGFVYDIARDRLIVFGGSAGRGSVNSSTWEWDGTTWKEFNGPGPGQRQAFAMVYDAQRKKAVVFGGMGSSPAQLYDDVWEFDGKSWQQIKAKGPGSRLSPGFTYDAKRKMMLIFGGAGNNSIAGDTWGWDGSNWKKLSETGPPPRMMGYMSYDKDREKVILFGGRYTWPNDANDTWEWDGNGWTEIK
jgi:hypothetical protein